jgi:hypothetical protein
MERYSRGKSLPELNEDIYVVTPHYVGVIDGATDKTGNLIEGMKGGQFVAKVIADLHESGDLPQDLEMKTWVCAVTAEIDRRLSEGGWPVEIQRPAASAVFYSVFRRQIFRVGDCHYRVNGQGFLGGKLIDDHIAGIRASHLRLRLSQGDAVEDIQQDDTGRALILDLLKEQFRYANASSGEFAYPVFNGFEVPENLQELAFSVPEGSVVVMTSDGFDFPSDTLHETIRRQMASYALDPLRVGLDDARPSPKGLMPGVTQHDDCTYLSFKT